MIYRLVIFDFDGTLANSGGWFKGILNDLARQHGFRALTEAEMTMLRGRDNRDIMRYLKVPRWKLPAIAVDARRRMAADAERIALFDGIVPMLRSLKQAGLMVAVASSNSQANVRRILGSEATALVDAFECGAALFGKAGKFRKLMKWLGAAPGETICIGDETRDIEAANVVGAASGAVLWGYATAEALTRFSPTLSFATPEEITQRLASRAA